MEQRRFQFHVWLICARTLERGPSVRPSVWYASFTLRRRMLYLTPSSIVLFMFRSGRILWIIDLWCDQFLWVLLRRSLTTLLFRYNTWVLMVRLILNYKQAEFLFKLTSSIDSKSQTTIYHAVKWKKCRVCIYLLPNNKCFYPRYFNYDKLIMHYDNFFRALKIAYCKYFLSAFPATIDFKLRCFRKI